MPTKRTLTPRQQHLLRLLPPGQTVRPSDVLPHFAPLTLDQLGSVFRQLLARGLVQRTGHGRYALTPEGQAARTT